MKVAIVGPYPEPGGLVTGGVERVIDTLLPELAKRVDLTLIVPGANRHADGRHHGVLILYVERGPGPGAARYWTVDARRLARVIEQERPDLVHLQGVAGVGWLINRPAIYTAHGIVDRDLVETWRGK